MKNGVVLSQRPITGLNTNCAFTAFHAFSSSLILEYVFKWKAIWALPIIVCGVAFASHAAPDTGTEPTKPAVTKSPRKILSLPEQEQPLIELNWEANTGVGPVNTGTAFASDFKRSSPRPSFELQKLPPAKVGVALDFGGTPGDYFVESVEVINELKNLKSFTIMGWINSRSNVTGSGGNRIVSWINDGGEGVDLVYKNTGSLQLGVNEWPDNSPAISSPGIIPHDPLAPGNNWVFFAVTYNSINGKVQFYFGKEGDATLDVTREYRQGAVGDDTGKLAIGHFNDATRPRALDRMFRGLIDNLQIYDSELAATDIVAIQNISGAPDTEPPTAPVLSVDAKSNTAVSLIWQGGGDNDRLSVNTLFSGTKTVAVLNPDLTEYNVTGLTPNTTYAFSLQARDHAGNTATSNVVSVTTDSAALLSTNTEHGHEALFSNTTGFNNTANGYRALFSNTTGSGNTATGADALVSNTTSFNSAYGYAAMRFTTIGKNNSAFGAEALFHNTAGSGNNAFGNRAMAGNTHGYDNTAVGNEAFFMNTEGFRNTAIGANALVYNTTGYYNTALGAGAGSKVGLTGLHNSTAIGQGAKTTASNQVRIGDSEVTSIGGQVSWSTLSDGRFKKDIKEDVSGLEFLNQLRPVSYIVDKQQVSQFLGNTDNTESRPSDGSRKKNTRQSGFVAQEVEALMKKTGFVFYGLDIPQNENDHYSIRYAEFVVPLVKAVQELYSLIGAQKSEIEALKAQLNRAINAETFSSVGAELYQNNPNPFSGDTEIKMNLPDDAMHAKVIVYNLEGRELQNYLIRGRGKTSVKITGSELNAGMYLYTLIVDGKIVDTRRMILTK